MTPPSPSNSTSSVESSVPPLRFAKKRSVGYSRPLLVVAAYMLTDALQAVRGDRSAQRTLTALSDA
jgi:hypothetical protein